MQIMLGMLIGAGAVAMGFISGLVYASKKVQRIQEPEETPEDAARKERDKNMAEQWDAMLRYDGRSEQL